MNDLVDALDLASGLREAGLLSEAVRDFEAMYDELSRRTDLTDLRETIDARLETYFADLKLPDEVTIYDLLVATLRPKDIIATFNWDPFILQAFERNRPLGHAPHVLFLHGNVALGYCEKDKLKGARGTCPACRRSLTPSRLLYPVANKDYTQDALVAAEWSALERRLENAYLLTIFGYADPQTDVAAKSLMQQAWNANLTRGLAEIEVVDIETRRRLAARWDSFIVSHHWVRWHTFRSTLQHRFPRRSCEAWAFATLQQEPWHERPVPRFRRLDHLHRWLRPLIEEEDALERDGRPLGSFNVALH